MSNQIWGWSKLHECFRLLLLLCEEYTLYKKYWFTTRILKFNDVKPKWTNIYENFPIVQKKKNFYIHKKINKRIEVREWKLVFKP